MCYRSGEQHLYISHGPWLTHACRYDKGLSQAENSSVQSRNVIYRAALLAYRTRESSAANTLNQLPCV